MGVVWPTLIIGLKNLMLQKRDPNARAVFVVILDGGLTIDIERIDSQHITIHMNWGPLRTMQPHYLRAKHGFATFLTQCSLYHSICG